MEDETAASRAFLADLAPVEDAAWDEVHTTSGRRPRLSAEFWTSRQRQAANLHEISYRACYKPQLPRHFIERLTLPGERVYDPFSGRGTTALEAALMGRRVAANDLNPLSRMLAEPRLTPPDPADVARRLAEIPRAGASDGLGLDMFFHPDTEAEIRGLRSWCLDRAASGELDAVDAWIRMVATNRLTGHSPGFFSVYTLPPNQAVTADTQRQINAKRNQTPTYRDTHTLILKKTRQLLAGLDALALRNLAEAAEDAQFLTGDARATPALEDGSVALTVTSPPFLDVVDYVGDNWLR
ncbi:MAG TPA: DNA methyltransferase, partial [Geothrix sp.]|nr:DNA methyltransferase [Geothrix sp.]